MEPLLRVDNLTKHFRVQGGPLGGGKGVVKAVDNITFDVMRGETLGLVGESGSGKSTTGRLLLRLIEPTAGRAEFDGMDLFALSKSAMKPLRSRIQIVFQDPYGSLNPRMTVSNVIREGLEPRRLSKTEQENEITRLLETVGLRSAHRNRYPHEFSGGQRQRIGIARALGVKPDFLIADEPVSALDVSVQAQVLNLLLELQQSLSLTMLFIAHDLAVVRHMSDRIAVMYQGKIVELARAESIYVAPAHPYTRTLLDAIPIPDPDSPPALPVEPQGVAAIEGGCVFRTRCQFAQDQCSTEPILRELSPGRFAACHFADTLPEYTAGRTSQISLSPPGRG